jgi:hypothetical protein
MDRLIRKGKRLRDARKKLLRKGKNSSKPKVIVIKEGKSKGDKYDTCSYKRTANKGPVISNINVLSGISFTLAPNKKLTTRIIVFIYDP